MVPIDATEIREPFAGINFVKYEINSCLCIYM